MEGRIIGSSAHHYRSSGAKVDGNSNLNSIQAPSQILIVSNSRKIQCYRKNSKPSTSYHPKPILISCRSHHHRPGGSKQGHRPSKKNKTKPSPLPLTSSNSKSPSQFIHLHNHSHPYPFKTQTQTHTHTYRLSSRYLKSSLKNDAPH
jgi:hypothetical protein